MKFSEIQSFIAVAATGSIRAAARQRGLSAPALTKNIARLEEELHAALVVRTTRGAVLSDVGQTFLQRARLISAEMAKASEEMAQMQGRYGGRVVVGASMTPAMTVLPPALLAFRRERPEVQVSVVGGRYETHLEGIRNGTMDFAIGAIPLQGLEAEFAVEPLFENELVIATRRRSRWCRARSLAALAQAEWITLGPGTRGTGAAVLDAFAAQGLAPPRIMIECDSVATLQPLLMTSDTVCVMAAALMRHEPFRRFAVAIPIAEPLPVYPVGLFRRAASPLLPSAALLAAQVRREAAALTR